MGTPRTIGEVPESSGSVDDRGPAGNELNRKTMKWGARLIAVAAPFVVLAQASRRCISRTLYHGLLVRLIGVCLGAGAAHAQDAIWLLSPGSGNWNTAARCRHLPARR